MISKNKSDSAYPRQPSQPIFYCLFELMLENRVKPVVDEILVGTFFVITHYHSIL